MRNDIYVVAIIYTTLSVGICVQGIQNNKAENSTDDSMRNKRFLHGFGSSGIFQRVFDHSDNRPFISRFTGGDQPSITHGQNPPEYQQNWDDGVKSFVAEDDDESEEEYDEDYEEEYVPPFYHQIFPSSEYDLKVVKIDNDDDDKSSVKEASVAIKPERVEYIFNSLPHYEKNRPFKNQDELKKTSIKLIQPIMEVGKSQSQDIVDITTKEEISKDTGAVGELKRNHPKVQVVASNHNNDEIKTTSTNPAVMTQYAFNSLPHYEIKNVFSKSTKLPLENTAEKHLTVNDLLAIPRNITDDPRFTTNGDVDVDFFKERNKLLKTPQLIENVFLIDLADPRIPPKVFPNNFDKQIETSYDQVSNIFQFLNRSISIPTAFIEKSPTQENEAPCVSKINFHIKNPFNLKVSNPNGIPFDTQGSTNVHSNLEPANVEYESFPPNFPTALPELDPIDFRNSPGGSVKNPIVIQQFTTQANTNSHNSTQISANHVVPTSNVGALPSLHLINTFRKPNVAAPNIILPNTEINAHTLKPVNPTYESFPPNVLQNTHHGTASNSIVLKQFTNFDNSKQITTNHNVLTSNAGSLPGLNPIDTFQKSNGIAPNFIQQTISLSHSRNQNSNDLHQIIANQGDVASNVRFRPNLNLIDNFRNVNGGIVGKPDNTQQFTTQPNINSNPDHLVQEISTPNVEFLPSLNRTQIFRKGIVIKPNLVKPATTQAKTNCSNLKTISTNQDISTTNIGTLPALEPIHSFRKFKVVSGGHAGIIQQFPTRANNNNQHSGNSNQEDVTSNIEYLPSLKPIKQFRNPDAGSFNQPQIVDGNPVVSVKIEKVEKIKQHNGTPTNGDELPGLNPIRKFHVVTIGEPIIVHQISMHETTNQHSGNLDQVNAHQQVEIANSDFLPGLNPINTFKNPEAGTFNRPQAKERNPIIPDEIVNDGKVTTTNNGILPGLNPIRKFNVVTAGEPNIIQQVVTQTNQNSDNLNKVTANQEITSNGAFPSSFKPINKFKNFEDLTFNKQLIMDSNPALPNSIVNIEEIIQRGNHRLNKIRFRPKSPSGNSAFNLVPKTLFIQSPNHESLSIPDVNTGNAEAVILHKSIRKDRKKLPTESNFSFNTLPHFQNNISWNVGIENKNGIRNLDNTDDSVIENTQIYVPNNFQQIANFPLDSKAFDPSKTKRLYNSFGELIH